MKSQEINKRSFVMYNDQYEILKVLTDEQAGLLMKAVFNYQANGVEPELDPMMGALFVTFKITLDRDRAKFNDECKKRADAGRKGGLKTQARLKQKQVVLEVLDSEQANQADSDSDSVSENESDIKDKDVASLQSGKEPVESRDKKPKPEEKKAFNPPALLDVVKWAEKWAVDKEKDQHMVVESAKKAWKYYSNLDWHDARGAKIKSWKHKIIAVWFTDDKIAEPVDDREEVFRLLMKNKETLCD